MSSPEDEFDDDLDLPDAEPSAPVQDEGLEAVETPLGAEEDGLAHAARLIRAALEPRLRETAYALACEVVAAERLAQQDCLRMLEFIRHELHLDPLVTAAIERGARARHQKV